MTNTKLKSVLFDLDGTLVDTAPDLAFALNYLLKKNNRPVLPFEIIRPQAGHGSKALIGIGFGIDETHNEYRSLWLELLEIYSQHIAVQTTLFPEMDRVLSFIEQQNLTWGIVTNKPGWLTDPLLEKLNLTGRAKCVVSGDTLPQRKPAPEPMWHACKLIGVKPSECVYIGDAERDVQSAKSAGIHALLAMFGYLGENDTPHLWNADGFIEKPADIIEWLKMK